MDHSLVSCRGLGSSLRAEAPRQRLELGGSCVQGQAETPPLTTAAQTALVSGHKAVLDRVGNLPFISTSGCELLVRCCGARITSSVTPLSLSVACLPVLGAAHQPGGLALWMQPPGPVGPGSRATGARAWDLARGLPQGWSEAVHSAFSVVTPRAVKCRAFSGSAPHGGVLATDGVCLRTV